MTESITDKKQRLFGDSPTDNTAALKAVASKQWTAQDAAQLRKQSGDVKKQSHADRVAMTMKVGSPSIRQ